jgi:hypothetical protein
MAYVLGLAESGEFDPALLNSEVDVQSICKKKMPVGGPGARHNAEVLLLAAPLAEGLCKWVADPKIRGSRP